MLVSKGNVMVEKRFCEEKQCVKVVLGKRMLVSRQREGNGRKKRGPALMIGKKRCGRTRNS